jgi:hypothetical protein
LTTSADFVSWAGVQTARSRPDEADSGDRRPPIRRVGGHASLVASRCPDWPEYRPIPRGLLRGRSDIAQGEPSRIGAEGILDAEASGVGVTQADGSEWGHDACDASEPSLGGASGALYLSRYDVVLTQGVEHGLATSRPCRRDETTTARTRCGGGRLAQSWPCLIRRPGGGGTSAARAAALLVAIAADSVGGGSEGLRSAESTLAQATFTTAHCSRVPTYEQSRSA